MAQQYISPFSLWDPATFVPPISRTVRISPFRPQSGWTPVSNIRWSPRNSQSQLWYWADISDVLTDENDTIQNLAIGLPDTDGNLTLTEYTWIGGYIGVLPLGGTLGRLYTIEIQPFLVNAGAVDSVSIGLPTLSTPPAIAPPPSTVLHRGAVLQIAGITFPTDTSS